MSHFKHYLRRVNVVSKFSAQKFIENFRLNHVMTTGLWNKIRLSCKIFNISQFLHKLRCQSVSRDTFPNLTENSSQQNFPMKRRGQLFCASAIFTGSVTLTLLVDKKHWKGIKWKRGSILNNRVSWRASPVWWLIWRVCRPWTTQSQSCLHLNTIFCINNTPFLSNTNFATFQKTF